MIIRLALRGLSRGSKPVGLRFQAGGAVMVVFAVLLASSGLTVSSARAGEAVDFNRDIRRVLSDNCFKCHGPDARERKGGKHGGLRLDTREGAMADLGGYAAIVPGHPE